MTIGAGGPLMLNVQKVVAGPSRAVDACLSILEDEIRLAVEWSRPSLLIAVHRSEHGRLLAETRLEKRLEGLAKVVRLYPAGGPVTIRQMGAAQTDAGAVVLFVQGLGDDSQFVEGLNLQREVVVEQQLKLVLWLTAEELTRLSRHAPDFWAFRHRVIEFPAHRPSKRVHLPSGVLLWHLESPADDLEKARAGIVYEEQVLRSLSPGGPTAASHAQATANLAYYCWLAGECQEADNLIRRELKAIEPLALDEETSFLSNALAILCFDRGEYGESLGWVEQALRLSPKRGLFWSNRGVICRSAGRGRSSISSLLQATRSASPAAGNWRALGYTYLALEKYPAAIPCFERSAALQPDSAQDRIALAVCHARMGFVHRRDDALREVAGRAEENGYAAICRDGLSGEMPAALRNLKRLVLNGKAPLVFLRRDPNLRFIFGLAVLNEVVLELSR